MSQNNHWEGRACAELQSQLRLAAVSCWGFWLAFYSAHF